MKYITTTLLTIAMLINMQSIAQEDKNTEDPKGYVFTDIVDITCTDVKKPIQIGHLLEFCRTVIC